MKSSRHGDYDYQPMHVVEDVVRINPQLGDVVVDQHHGLVLLIQRRDREQLRLKELGQRCHPRQFKSLTFSKAIILSPKVNSVLSLLS